jgi:hypothetical protein
VSTDSSPEADDASTRLRRNPAPYVLGAVITVLALYYVVLWATGALRTSIDVPVDAATPTTSRDYVTLQLRVQDVDLTRRVIEADVLPLAHGALAGRMTGEMRQGLRIGIARGSETTSVVTFPRRSVVDPMAVTLPVDRGDAAYPFDRPFTDFVLSVQDDATGAAVPFEVQMSNSARPWALSAVIAQPDVRDGVPTYRVTVDGHRDPLNITLVAFYVLAMLMTTVIAVTVIGSAILRGALEFSNIIWLSATMLAFPALRSAMPGAPPIGTALDFVLFFPCMCLVAAMLLWTAVHLLGRERGLLRRLRLPHDLG